MNLVALVFVPIFLQLMQPAYETWKADHLYFWMHWLQWLTPFVQCPALDAQCVDAFDPLRPVILLAHSTADAFLEVFPFDDVVLLEDDDCFCVANVV